MLAASASLGGWLGCTLYASSVPEAAAETQGMPCMYTFCRIAAGLDAYKIRQTAGCLVCTFFAGGGLFFGVCLVYALFENKEKKREKKREKRGCFMYAHYGGKEYRLVYALYAGSRRREGKAAGLGMHIMTVRRGMKKGAHIKYAPKNMYLKKYAARVFMHLMFSPFLNSLCKCPHLVIRQPGISGNRRERKPTLL